jgi:alkanesulfonate monooxygenase SsuD/methylene tetrahydromethanopterin reductase-like flavin-dependent oxidoreductase (luciferase family)
MGKGDSMTAHERRLIRFGLIASGAAAAELIETAKSGEQHGFSGIALNDHFNSTVAPLLGLQAMAAATSRIRIAWTTATSTAPGRNSWWELLGQS